VSAATSAESSWLGTADLAPEDRQAVLAVTSRRGLRAGQVLFAEGDPADAMYLLTRGTLAVRVVSPDGDVATVAVLVAGETVGEQALVSPARRRTATVAAREPSEVLRLGRDAFESLRSGRPVLDRLLVATLARRLETTTARLLEALYVPADVRALRRVVHLATSAGTAAGPVSLTVTQEELATMAGTTRSTVNRALRAAERDGLIELRRGGVVVVDADGLALRTA
jgi:CRP/FNR family cyclic AMP-dependent transcriptional regulator